MGWSSEQRRALAAFLSPTQRTTVCDRIEARRLAGHYEAGEARAAVHFATSGGDGDSYGIVEYEAVCLFGRDPAFVEEWRRVRRMHEEDPADVGGRAVSARGTPAAATDVAARLHGRRRPRRAPGTVVSHDPNAGAGDAR